MPNGAPHPTDAAWTLEEVLDRVRFRQSREQLSPIVQLLTGHIGPRRTPRMVVRVDSYESVLRWAAAMHRSTQPERITAPEEGVVAYCASLPDVFGSGWLVEITARIVMPHGIPVRDDILDAAEAATVTRADAGQVVANAVLALSGAVQS